MDAPATTANESAHTQSNPSEGFSFSTYLLSFTVAVVLYALSPGPVAKCLSLDRTLTPALLTAYAPLGLCCDYLPGVDNFYEWYMNVWQVP